MPGDLAVNAASSVPAAPSAVGPSGSPAPVSGAGAAGHRAAQEHGQEPLAANASGASPLPLYANPVSQLDPALGIVVLQFFNAEGVQTASIPSAKQLESYRVHGRSDAAEPASVVPTIE